jgi:hypothetical protein
MSNLNLSRQMDACIYYISFCNFQGNKKKFLMWSCVRVLALAMVIVSMLHYHCQILSIEWNS